MNRIGCSLLRLETSSPRGCHVPGDSRFYWPLFTFYGSGHSHSCTLESPGGVGLASLQLAGDAMFNQSSESSSSGSWSPFELLSPSVKLGFGAGFSLGGFQVTTEV